MRLKPNNQRAVAYIAVAALGAGVLVTAGAVRNRRSRRDERRSQQRASAGNDLSDASYNYDTFRRYMIRRDLRFHGGPQPGESAPDLELPTVAGGRFRLSDHRGRRPVLVEFASVTCPMVLGARPVLINLHREFSPSVVFVSVYVREAHPGERYPHHTSDTQKMRHALAWVELDAIPWTVAVDTTDGRAHETYGLAPNGIYLISSAGKVAFRAVWAGQEAALREKIGELLEREATGETEVNLGQSERFVIPLLRGAVEVDPAVTRGGEKAREDFRREMGNVIYGTAQLMSRLYSVFNPR